MYIYYYSLCVYCLRALGRLWWQLKLAKKSVFCIAFLFTYFFLRFFRMFSFRRRMAIRIVVLAATADRNVKGNVTQLEAASHKHLY